MSENRLERFQKELESRRTFLHSFVARLLGLSAAGSFLSALLFLYPPSRKNADDGLFRGADGKPLTPGDVPPGSGVVGRLGSRPVLVLNQAGKLTALSAVCTHLGCIVAWDGDSRLIRCPCHGGVFAPDGRNIAGPPPRPLPHFPLAVVNGMLVTPSKGSTG